MEDRVATSLPCGATVADVGPEFLVDSGRGMQRRIGTEGGIVYSLGT